MGDTIHILAAKFMLFHCWTVDFGNAPRNSRTCQEGQGKRRLPAKKHGCKQCKVKSKSGAQCVFRLQGYTQHVLVRKYVYECEYNFCLFQRNLTG